ncbi:DUF6624 domain-containing protein [Marinilabilia sp.]|uniref:DUF6624 domain-containing protein n=1 Tax=Marinilabilia sp. TaxID=2021252 RepID=UPI00345C910F
MRLCRLKCYLVLILFPIISESGCTARNHIDTDTQSDNYDSLRIVLESVYDSDQSIRKQMHDPVYKDSIRQLKYISQMIAIDQENLHKVLPILEKYGWIPQSKIGEKASDAIFYVIQHSSIELMEKYFWQLDSLALLGEASRKNAAMMEDRLLMGKGLKQIYGSQATTNLRPDKSLVIWPVSQPDKVDSLRKSVGFELSVLENADRIGAVFNPNEELPIKDLHK